MKESKGKETFKKPFLFLGLAFVALGCTLGFSSLAWFATPATSATVTGMEGEATGSYFESGVGTESDPYIIANAKQLYYFAWLQDMGFFNAATTTVTSEDGSTKPKIQTTYFKIKDGLTTIDASAYTLPPVGIEKYPFVGNFDANNCTITGLTISNKIGTGYIEEDKYPTLLDTANTRLTKDEFNSTSQASIVGFFGIIGQYNSIPSATYDSDANEVKNLYLDEITIKTTDKSNLLIGIFAGYANGLIDNCGVHYAKFDINRATSKIDGFNKVSEYSLIGSYNKTKFKWETTSGGSSGGDAGYGTSTNIRSLHTFLTKFSLTTDGSDGVIKSGMAIPFQPDSNVSISEKSGTIAVGGRTVTNASTIATNSSATNIGYYVGGDTSSFDSATSMRILKDHYNSSNINFDNIQVSSSNSDVTSVPDRVKTYLKNVVSGDTLQGYSVLRMSTANNLGITMLRDTGYYGIESGKVGSYQGNILVPNNCIWVAPQQAGTFEFVCTTENTSASYIYIWKLKRSDPGNYSSSLSTPDLDKQAFKFGGDSSIEAVGMTLYGASNPYKSYYYGTPINQDDIDDGVEFAITFAMGSSALYIVYIDIGSDSGSSSGETTTTRTLNTTFDWVTKENNALTKIKNADGSEIVGNTYNKSEVFFEIGDTEISRTFSWRRTTVDGETLVLYYEQYTPTTATAVMSAVGKSGKSNKAENGDCEAKAAA